MDGHWYGIRIRPGHRFRIESAGKAIKEIRFKPGEEVVAVGYDNGMVEMWDMSSKGKNIRVYDNVRG